MDRGHRSGLRVGLAVTVLVALCGLVVLALPPVASATSPHPAGVVAVTRGQGGGTVSPGQPPGAPGRSPLPTESYGLGHYGPHQDSGLDQMGPLSPGKRVAIAAIVAATLIVIAVIAIRSRRARARERDGREAY